MPAIEVRKSLQEGEIPQTESEELREEFKEAQVYFRDYQGNLMQDIGSWNFPMFELAYKTDNIMSQVSIYI